MHHCSRHADYTQSCTCPLVRHSAAAMTAERLSVDQLAARWAACIASAERPLNFSSRDGSLLRLVASNERLPREQLQLQLEQLLTAEQHLQNEFSRNLKRTSSKSQACRHLVAWARGWCYLQSGNHRQALRDANTALAYAARSEQPKGNSKVKPRSEQSTASVPNTQIESADSRAAQDHRPATDRQTAVALTEQTSGTPNTTAAAVAVGGSSVYANLSTCTWPPALLLAAECLTALQQPAQAVLLLAQAAQQDPDDLIIANRLSAVSHQLTPEQSYAWTSGGFDALLQQLQDEADMRLPEVLRPRLKWYYYNRWMTQRIHTALLELHLGCPFSSIGISEGTTTEQLTVAAQAAADTPAVAAAAEAAGFLPRLPLVSSEEQQQQQLLQLPGPVVDKLLSLDAGDLDLMIKHPTALQAQVYELLDVYEAQGPTALQSYTVPHLTWEEVQALAAASTDGQTQSQLVGLSLGYTPPRKQPSLPPGVAAVLPSVAAARHIPLLPAAQSSIQPAPASEPDVTSAPPSDLVSTCKLKDTQCQAEAAERASSSAVDTAVGACAVKEGCSRAHEEAQAVIISAGPESMCEAAGQTSFSSWRQQGWKRSDYLLGYQQR